MKKSIETVPNKVQELDLPYKDLNQYLKFVQRSKGHHVSRTKKKVENGVSRNKEYQ